MQFISCHSAVSLSTSLQLIIKPRVISMTHKVLLNQPSFPRLHTTFLRLLPPAPQPFWSVCCNLTCKLTFHSELLIYSLISLEWPSPSCLHGFSYISFWFLLKCNPVNRLPMTTTTSLHCLQGNVYLYLINSVLSIINSLTEESIECLVSIQ